jgi:hypothetical protein
VRLPISPHPQRAAKVGDYEKIKRRFRKVFFDAHCNAAEVSDTTMLNNVLLKV